MAQVVIIGAGLSGLSTAYYLEQNKFFDYALIEKNARPGGLLRSETVNGFTFDYTGHFLHCNHPLFNSFLRDVVGLEHLMSVTRSSSIFSHNTYTCYPFQMNLFGLPTDVIAECIQGYVQRTTHNKNPQNFYAWVLKYFGRGFGKHFFFPFNRKLAAYDVRRMHPSWTGRFVPSTNLEAIIKGALAHQNAQIGYNSSFYYPQSGGIEIVIKRLCATLSCPLTTLRNIAKIDPLTKTIFYTDGTQEYYRTLISTMPLNQLLTLLAPSSRMPLNQYASSLACNAIVNINLGFTTSLPLHWHWTYFPEPTYPWHRLGYWHNICPQMAPAGRSSLYAEFSYQPKQMPQHLIAEKTHNAIAKILEFLGLSDQHIMVKNILILDHAYVIYTAWREQNIDKILSSLRAMDIYSIGRYGAWKYSSMQEAVIEGYQTAQIVCKKEKLQWKQCNDFTRASAF